MSNDATETHDDAHEAEASQDPTTPYDENASGGWGSLKGVSRLFLKERPDIGAIQTLLRQNKPKGHMCSSCAWAKPPDPHPAEFCENGAKATLWELTRDRCTPDFFAEHTLAELRGWADHGLEMVGRLTHPMRYDAGTDRYVPVGWDEAFADIASRLGAIDPKAAVFYASGHAGLEASFLYALFARLYGHNNLPQSSNMCHETTSVGLKKVIGSPVGTCTLPDFEHCDLILFFGQNTGSNSPRFLHPLKSAKDRGCRIITFNPVRERGLVEFVDPQNPVQMLASPATKISDLYLQVRPGGDIAAIMGVAKRVFELDDEHGDVIDRDFIAEHTTGFEAFERTVRETAWSDIEAASGLSREHLEEVGTTYARSERVIGIYGMGLTQHVHGAQNIGMLTNLLLLRGNIGREGAGISPVRGHSNVQGQRTVGIAEKVELVPVEALEAMFDFTVPKEDGRNIVEAMEGLLDGSVQALISLGGNLARAVPDDARMEPRWSDLACNVQIATKLNRSHIVVGEGAYLLPCISRAEEDLQASGPQAITVEDSLSHIHGSIGKRAPASEHLRSELAIIAGLAKATLPRNDHVRWDEWTGDYGLVRELIERCYPDDFKGYNARMFDPGGFYRGNAAREREWKTESGRAEFTDPTGLIALVAPLEGEEATLITLRSNDQFNTTIYGYSDRLRGLDGDRMIVMINRYEMQRRNLEEGQEVTLVGPSHDGVERRLGGMKVQPYDLPDGCVAAYYPEANPLVPLDRHDRLSKTPAYKGTPVRIEA